MHFGVTGKKKKRPEKDAVILKEHFKKKSPSHIRLAATSIIPRRIHRQ